jgi:hypothetical protein
MAATNNSNSRPAGDRDQPGDIHEPLEAAGGTGRETEGDRPSNLQKAPDDWTTGDESMTDAQRSYLTTLSQEAGEDPPGELSKAEASKRIDELQRRTGRGRDH